MDKKTNDILMGKMNEDYIKEVLTTHFALKDLVKLDLFHPMDFISNDEVYWEIKSRRFNHDKYLTTMIGKNKIDWIRKNKITNAYFVFVFEDGDYYYKFNNYDNFLAFAAVGGRCDRGYSEIKAYYYIPIDMLKKII